jgi:hypothetical protein
MAITPVVILGTAAADLIETKFPMPSCPLAFLPQQNIAPALVRAQECGSPATIL